MLWSTLAANSVNDVWLPVLTTLGTCISPGYVDDTASADMSSGGGGAAGGVDVSPAKAIAPSANVRAMATPSLLRFFMFFSL